MKMLISLILLSSAFTFAQVKEIKGIIRDGKTNELLPYANVQLAGTPLGTTSNLNGEFLLRISSFPAKVVVSFVGYQTDTMMVERGDTNTVLNISLNKIDIILPEVTVSASDTFAVALVKRTYENISDNEDKIVNGDAFYREYLTVDSQYSEIMEMFLATSLNSRGIAKNAIENGRFARLKRPPGDSVIYFYYGDMLNFSVLTFKSNQHKDPFFSFLPWVQKSFAYYPIRPNAEEYYYLKTDGFYRTDAGKKVAVITFTAKGNLDKPAFSGTMEIDVNSSQLLHINEEFNFYGTEFHLVPWPHYMGYYATDSVLSFTADFKTLSNGNYYLNRLEAHYGYVERNEKDPSFDRHYSFVSFLTFYDYPEEANILNLESPNLEWDINRVMHAGYNPDFWKKHENVIGEIPMEKNIEQFFIKNGFYGNLFPGGEPLPQDGK